MANESNLPANYWESDNSTDEETCHADTPEAKILQAVLEGKTDLIETLLKEDPSLVSAQDEDGYSPLHRASYSGYKEIVEMLLSHGADVSSVTKDLWQPLHSASKWNNAECADVLLRHGADINAQTQGGQTPLHLAATNAKGADTLQVLLMHPNVRADVRNGAGETALEIGMRSGKLSYLFEIVHPSINTII